MPEPQEFGIGMERTHSLDGFPIGRDLRLELFRASFLLVEGKFLCFIRTWLSRLGGYGRARVEGNLKDAIVLCPGNLDFAALHGGLLYVRMQNETDRQSKSGPRLICYDVRK